MKTLRMMTTVHLANHGGCIFAYSLYRTLLSNLPSYEVRTLDYIPRNWFYHELLRAFKPQSNALTFGIRRFLLSERFHRDYLNLEKPTAFYPVGYEGMVDFLTQRKYDALVVGMVIWDITDLPQIPRFPNIYWLSENIPAIKIAYAASGHRSKASLIKKNLPTIQRILSSYALIGVRDQITYEIAMDSQADRCAPVVQVPDPAFLYENHPTRVDEILVSHGIDLDRPIMGILFYGKPTFSEALYRFYRAMGFQIVALSMYNPFADVNLGHLLSPFEWVDAFRYLSFCVTDRFHGTIFCLRNNIPFMSIEPYAPHSISNSKIYSLLNDFQLTDCYIDVLQADFKLESFFEHAESLRTTWEKNYHTHVSKKVNEMQTRSMDFIQQIKSILA